MLSIWEKVRLHSEMTEYGLNFLILDMAICQTMPDSTSDNVKLQSIELFCSSKVTTQCCIFKFTFKIIYPISDFQY